MFERSPRVCLRHDHCDDEQVASSDIFDCRTGGIIISSTTQYVNDVALERNYIFVPVPRSYDDRDAMIDALSVMVDHGQDPDEAVRGLCSVYNVVHDPHQLRDGDLMSIYVERTGYSLHEYARTSLTRETSCA